MINVKIFFSIILSILILGCSFGVGGNWNNISEEIKLAKEKKNAKIIFSTQKRFQSEINSSKEIKFKESIKNKHWNEKNFSSSNFLPHLSYDNNKNLIYKSKKLGKNNFKIINSDFEPLLNNNSIFFYDPSGSIFSFSVKNKKLNWKFNFYKNRFKSKPKEINLSITSQSVIVSDNLGYVYSLNKENGNIKWAKNYAVPFRSNIKIDGDNIFLINQDNKFYVISKRNGDQKLDLETFPSFLKTDSKTNISLDKLKKNVYFVTSAAEIYSLSYKNRNINWLFNLTGSNSDQKVDLFYSSPIIYQNDEIILSSSLSTFSMNSINGILNWEVPISSYILPILLNKNIFLGSKNGFIVNLNRQTGQVIWSRNIFSKLKKLTYEKTGNITSIMLLSNKIFISTEKGYFIFINHKNGQIINYFKVANNFFSKPIVSEGKIIIIDGKMRILQFN